MISFKLAFPTAVCRLGCFISGYKHILPVVILQEVPSLSVIIAYLSYNGKVSDCQRVGMLHSYCFTTI